MEYPLKLALRYLASKKRALISVGTAFAMLGVTLGVAALSIVMSVTGGFQEQFRDKVLGVNAHVLVLKYSVDFHEYRDVMKDMEGMQVEYPCIPSPHALWPLMTKLCSRTVHVTGVAPFTINPMMVTHKDRTATGVLLKGVDPELMPQVLDLPKHIMPGGNLDGLRRAGAKPPERHVDATHRTHRLRHGREAPRAQWSDRRASRRDPRRASLALRRNRARRRRGRRAPAPLALTNDAGAPEPVVVTTRMFGGVRGSARRLQERPARRRRSSRFRSIRIRARAPSKSRSCPASSSARRSRNARRRPRRLRAGHVADDRHLVRRGRRARRSPSSSASSRCSRPASINTTRSSSTPISTRRRPSTIRATA